MLKAILTVMVIMPDGHGVVGERFIKDCLPATVEEHITQIEKGLEEQKLAKKGLYYVCIDGKNIYRGSVIGEPV